MYNGDLQNFYHHISEVECFVYTDYVNDKSTRLKQQNIDSIEQITYLQPIYHIIFEISWSSIIDYCQFGEQYFVFGE